MGHAVTLKGEKVGFRGRLVDSIRVAVPTHPAKKGASDDLRRDPGLHDLSKQRPRQPFGEELSEAEMGRDYVVRKQARP